LGVRSQKRVSAEAWPLDELSTFGCTIRPDGLEEALRASLEEGGAAHGPPPAAKAAVKALARERLTAERLAQLGGDGVQCSVCRRVPYPCPGVLHVPVRKMATP
jgi:hypothetical protein